MFSMYSWTKSWFVTPPQVNQSDLDSNDDGSSAIPPAPTPMVAPPSTLPTPTVTTPVTLPIPVVAAQVPTPPTKKSKTTPTLLYMPDIIPIGTAFPSETYIISEKPLRLFHIKSGMLTYNHELKLDREFNAKLIKTGILKRSQSPIYLQDTLPPDNDLSNYRSSYIFTRKGELIYVRANLSKCLLKIDDITKYNTLLANAACMYTLAKLTNQDMESKVLEIKCHADGLEYRVIGLDGKLKTDKILWNELPSTFPQQESKIFSDEATLLPIILEATTKKSATTMTIDPNLSLHKTIRPSYLAEFQAIITANKGFHLTKVENDFIEILDHSATPEQCLEFKKLAEHYKSKQPKQYSVKFVEQEPSDVEIQHLKLNMYYIVFNKKMNDKIRVIYFNALNKSKYDISLAKIPHLEDCFAEEDPVTKAIITPVAAPVTPPQTTIVSPKVPEQKSLLHLLKTVAVSVINLQAPGEPTHPPAQAHTIPIKRNKTHPIKFKKFSALTKADKQEAIKAIDHYHQNPSMYSFYQAMQNTLAELRKQYDRQLELSLDSVIYKNHIAKAKKNNQIYVIESHEDEQITYYKECANLITNAEDFLNELCQLHLSAMSLSDSTLNLALNILPITKRFTNKWLPAYKKLMSSIQDLGLNPFIIKLASYTALKEDLLSLAAPFTQDIVSETIKENPFYESFKDQGNEWLSLLKTSKNKINSLQIVLSDLNKQLPQGGQARESIQKSLIDLNHILQNVQKFMSSGRTRWNTVALAWDIYEQVISIIRHTPQSYVSIKSVLTEHSMDSILQINAILRDTVLYLDTIELQYYLKEGLLQSMKLVGRKSIMEICKDFDDWLYQLGYQVEDRAPFKRAIKAKRSEQLVETLANPQEDPNRLGIPLLKKRIAKSNKEFKKEALSLQNVPDPLTTVSTKKKQEAFDLVSDRLKELQLEYDTSWFQWTDTKLNKIKLLSFIKNDLLKANVTFDDALENLASNERHRNIMHLLSEGRTGRDLKKAQVLYRLPSERIRIIDLEIAKLKSQRDDTYLNDHINKKIHLEDNIDALYKLKETLQKPGYRVDEALSAIAARNPRASTLLNKKDHALILKLKEIDQELTDDQIGKKLLTNSKRTQEEIQICLDNMFKIPDTQDKFIIDKINKRIKDLKEEADSYFSMNIDIKHKKIKLLETLKFKLETMSLHDALDSFKAEKKYYITDQLPKRSDQLPKKYYGSFVFTKTPAGLVEIDHVGKIKRLTIANIDAYEDLIRKIDNLDRYTIYHFDDESKVNLDEIDENSMILLGKSNDKTILFVNNGQFVKKAPPAIYYLSQNKLQKLKNGKLIIPDDAIVIDKSNYSVYYVDQGRLSTQPLAVQLNSWSQKKLQEQKYTKTNQLVQSDKNTMLCNEIINLVNTQTHANRLSVKLSLTNRENIAVQTRLKSGLVTKTSKNSPILNKIVKKAILKGNLNALKESQPIQKLLANDYSYIREFQKIITADKNSTHSDYHLLYEGRTGEMLKEFETSEQDMIFRIDCEIEKLKEFRTMKPSFFSSVDKTYEPRIDALRALKKQLLSAPNTSYQETLLKLSLSQQTILKEHEKPLLKDLNEWMTIQIASSERIVLIDAELLERTKSLNKLFGSKLSKTQHIIHALQKLRKYLAQYPSETVAQALAQLPASTSTFLQTNEAHFLKKLEGCNSSPTLCHR